MGLLLAALVAAMQIAAGEPVVGEFVGDIPEAGTFSNEEAALWRLAGEGATPPSEERR